MKIRSIRFCESVLCFVVLLLSWHVPAYGAAAPVKTVIGYATVTARLMPLWIAHEQGIFAKYGIDAQPILIRGAPTLVAGLASGDIHIGRTGGSAMLDGMPELASQVLDMPVRRGMPKGVGGLVDMVSGSTFATGVGLVQYGARTHGHVIMRDGDNVYSRVKKRMLSWLGEIF